MRKRMNVAASLALIAGFACLAAARAYAGDEGEEIPAAVSEVKQMLAGHKAAEQARQKREETLQERAESLVPGLREEIAANAGKRHLAGEKINVGGNGKEMDRWYRTSLNDKGEAKLMYEVETNWKMGPAWEKLRETKSDYEKALKEAD